MSLRLPAAISLQDIRQQNAFRIFHTLRQHPGSSQRELIELTGLDQGTISVIVNTLHQKNIVKRAKERPAGRVGRPRVALRLSEKAGILLGSSIEHNTVSVVATHLDGSILSGDSTRTGSNRAETLAKLHALIKQVTAAVGRRESDILGLGIGAPVVLQEGKKRILFGSNLGWEAVDVHDLVSEFKMPVYFDNDANAAALAEQRFGICQDIDNFLYVGGYSGVGGAIMMEGQLYRGARGFAGEIGHVEVVPNGRLCGCGSHGCLEAYVSEKAMLERFAERGAEALNLDNIMLLAKNGHQFAGYMLFEAGSLLGRALSVVNKVLNPETIVLGGTFASLTPFIQDELEHILSTSSLKALGFAPQIKSSYLAEDAVAMGGVVLALEGFLSQPGWFTQN